MNQVFVKKYDRNTVDEDREIERLFDEMVRKNHEEYMEEHETQQIMRIFPDNSSSY